MTNKILGVEIGGTKLQLAIGSPEGKLQSVEKGQVDVAAGGNGIRQWLKTHIPEFIKKEESRFGPIRAIGCGFGGPMDQNTGKVLQSIQIAGWEDFPIQAWFTETFNLPSTVDNDSNAAAWGEYCRGTGRGCQHFFYTNIGSGIGGGLILNGQLYDGQGFGAGEFGHSYIPDWTSKMPGKSIKIEQVCSGWAIESRLRTSGYVPETSELYAMFSGDLSNAHVQDLGECAKHGDEFAINEIDQVAHSLGIGLANVLSLTNVERIAIGGGVSNLGELLIDPIRRYTEQYEFVSSQNRYEIKRCSLGDEIVLVGAVLIANDTFNIE